MAKRLIVSYNGYLRIKNSFFDSPSHTTNLEMLLHLKWPKTKETKVLRRQLGISLMTMLVHLYAANDGFSRFILKINLN